MQRKHEEWKPLRTMEWLPIIRNADNAARKNGECNPLQPWKKIEKYQTFAKSSDVKMISQAPLCSFTNFILETDVLF